MEPMRLQKFMARCGVASRRASEDIILAGRVEVNGIVTTELGVKINPDTDRVVFDGMLLEFPEENATFMLNKPTGVISSMGDPYGRATVEDFLPLNQFPSLFPVGRLDEDTTGLLLFTTDGEMGNALLHPKNHAKKTYRVTVEGALTSAHIARFMTGIMLEDGLTAPGEVSRVEHLRTTSAFDLTIHEGKNREVRRMCDALHLPVIALHRHHFAGLDMGTLASGQVRRLTEKEVEILKKATL